MKKRWDVTLNDFEIQSIIKLCPEFDLKFQIIELPEPQNYSFTMVEVFDKEGNPYQNFTTLDFNRSGENEFRDLVKIEISDLVDKINNSKPRAKINASGLCPEIVGKPL